MNKEKREIQVKLEHFKELYADALLAAEETRDRMTRNMEQYLGSDEIDGSTEKAAIVRNITYEIVESQISADIPVPKVDTSCYSTEREKNARTIERLSYALRSRLPFEELNDRDERYTYVYGASVFYVEWDSRQSDSAGEGGVKVHLLSPMNFIPQPSIQTVEDMEYCFLRFTTTCSELMNRYSVKEEELSQAECEYCANSEDPMGDAVALVVVFYRGEDGRVGKFVFSGDLPLSDMPNYYKRKSVICEGCGKDPSGCQCNSAKRVYRDVEQEKVILPDGKTLSLPYYVPDDFPIIIRKNTLGDMTLFGGSDCDRIRPQQQAINKVETRILQKLLRAGVTPIMPEGTAITLSNAVFGQIIKTRPGESMDSYGKIDTTPDISQDIEEADRLYDQAKRVLGISDALQGLDTNNSESGYARELKIARSSSRLETKKRMKHLAYCKLYQLIFKHYLAFADEPRRFAYRDTFGRMHFSEFNRYDFIEQDKNGNYYYDDSYLFSVDINSDTKYQNETLWNINLTNLERGTLGSKEETMTLLRYWQLQERANYPYARDNVEYFKDLLDRQENTQNHTERENNNEQKEGKKRLCQYQH